MAGYRNSRMEEDLKREICALIRELKDPRVKDCMLSVVKTDLSGDLSYCKVYISAMEGLDSASGFMRHELSNRLHLRRCPELKFIPDNSIEQSAHIARIIEDLEDK